MRYSVTACWYETVEVEAEDEMDAVDKAYQALLPCIRRNGPVDDYDVKEVDEE